MKVIAVFKLLLASENDPQSIQMRVTAGIFLASILLKEIRYLVYIRYLCSQLEKYDRYLLHSDKIGLNQLLYEDFAHFETPCFNLL
jgi:hypothetical protein